MATILIAEDDHAISDLVAYNLERAGHTPLAAYDGLTALEVARRDKPELILLDQMMPGMDGHGVLRELRRDSRTQNIRWRNYLPSCWDRHRILRQDARSHV